MLKSDIYIIVASAVADIDYTAVSSSLEFPENSANGAVQCVNIMTIEDTFFEGDATFTVRLTVMTSGVTTGNDETTINIIDNDGQSHMEINFTAT